MHSNSFFIFFSLLTSLISGVAALGTLYRCDTRDPATIKAGGGFKSWGRGTPTQARLISHTVAVNTDIDPFIATTTDMECGVFGDYRYTLDSSKITNKIWDVNAEYKKAGKMNHAEHEMEQAVEFEIPWAAVISVHHKKGGMFVPMAMPAKRAPFAHDARARLERI
ncbi:hypothetical protein GQ44DRAFT_775917 [Phaeosphaeriaceae sp. PMI808]|nr:hypothetical protein GQ44DRAFT_775917 [Phaeosphaeriaceae sp. PMI808]